MGLTRRAFSIGLLGWVSAPAWCTEGLSSSGRFLASASRDRQGRHWFQLLTLSGEIQLKVPLPDRAHQVVAHPHLPLIAVVGRRPSNQLLIINFQTGQVQHKITCPDGYHLFGHAVFTNDGRYLITTENHIEPGEGRLRVRSVEQQFASVADWPSYGIGPHELALLSDQKTLVVANGGILTHPSQGRKKLNLDTMRPSLAYVSLTDGRLLEQHRLDDELHQLSIRHLDVNQQDQVVMVMQYQGDRFDEVPLVASHRMGGAIRLLEAPLPTTLAMKQYCGSVRFEDSGRYALVSSPRGDLMTLWDIEAGHYLDQFRCVDGCGVAPDGEGQFMLSNGRGNIYRYDIAKKQLSAPIAGFELAWDNHLARV